MRYLGGKFRIRKQIASYLNSVRDGRDYLEPFVGAAWVLQEMDGKRVASDANVALITMYKALQEGWVPPGEVTPETHAWYKTHPDASDPMTAFVRIGCGFGGDWNGSYAREGARHPVPIAASSARNSLLKQLPLIRDVEFRAGDYSTHTHTQLKDRLIYCDPPYAGTTPYGACEPFDHSRFWDTMRLWSRDNIVVISEYTAPEDFECVAEFQVMTDLRTKSGRQARIERLFRLRATL